MRCHIVKNSGKMLKMNVSSHFNTSFQNRIFPFNKSVCMERMHMMSLHHIGVPKQ